jgi:putative FmdB family regulatory protein
MPIYEYQCEKCAHEFEREQRITDDPVKTCPKCRGRKVKKLISQTSFVLKGGGWYSDLYSSAKDSKKGADAEGSSSSGESGSDGGEKGGKSSKSDEGGKKPSKSDSTSKSDKSSARSGGKTKAGKKNAA